MRRVIPITRDEEASIAAALEHDPKVRECRSEWHGSPAMRIAVMANSDVDSDAPSDLPARGQRVSERSAGCGMGAAGAADPAGAPWRTTAQDRHAGGDERHPVSAAHRLSLALPAA